MIRTPSRRRRLVLMGLDNPIHIVFIVVILLLVFGAKRLPEIGRSLGSGMREFKDSVSGNQASSAQQQPTLTPAAQQPQQAPVAQPAPVQAPVPPVAAPPTPAQAAPPRLRPSRSPNTRPKPPERYRACAPVLAGAQIARNLRPRRVQRVCRIGPVRTASKAAPGTCLISSKFSSFHRGSGAPVMYQEEPLSATIKP